MLAASHFRLRSRRVPRKVRYRRRIRRAKFQRFARKVRKAVGRKGKPPKWHIFRSTATVTAGATLIGTGQTFLDFGHGLQTHYDGLVALGAVAQMNVFKTAVGPPSTWKPDFADRFLNVYKSYMVIFITNNSSTAVYGKLMVARPRKHINDPDMYPGRLASNDLFGAQGSVPNDWVSRQGIANLGLETNYADYGDMTDKVAPTSLNDIGWVWHNSPSFKRYWKGKIKSFTWAPMECKKFTFKFKRRVNVDTASEYTMNPATTDPANVPVDFMVNPVQDWMLTPAESGFSQMHRGRGAMISFLVHGVPARDDQGGMGLTIPNLDCYWINGYKYGWSSPGRREFHVSSPNPLTDSTDVQVAIPAFGSAPGPIQVG